MDQLSGADTGDHVVGIACVSLTCGDGDAYSDTWRSA